MADQPRSNPPPPSSSLVPPEINLETRGTVTAGATLDYGSLAANFRHSGWRRNRDLVHASLRRTMQSTSRITAFQTCGDTAFIYRTKEPPHEYRLGGSGCKDRFCVPCARDRSFVLKTNVLKALVGKETRFITLTLAQTGEPLADMLQHLYKSFSKLRNRKAWRRHVFGGCAFLELHYERHTGEWNVHLHCVCSGRYWAQRDLSKEWRTVTKTSFITDIRFVEDDQRVARYVTKYVSKPFKENFINDADCLDEAVRATKGRRFCVTFGDWRGIKLSETPNDRDWEALGEFHDVVTRAVNGEADCLEAVRQVCGDDADNIMARERSARPPPPTDPPPPDQLTFSWPAVQFLT